MGGTVIAVYNLKGGVGKTAAAVNLSYLSSLDSKNTLLWDLDSQASASFYYQKKAKIKGGTKKLLGLKSDLAKVVKSTNYPDLDIIPADNKEHNIDLVLDDLKKSTQRIKKITDILKKEYDIIFIDCPPTLSLLSENIFNAADMVLLPTIPSTLSVRTYDQVVDFFNKNKLPLKKLAPFFSMADMRKRLHRDIIKDFAIEKEANTFLTHIPASSDVEKMGIHKAPVITFARTSKGGRAYINLWKEVKKSLKLK